MPFGLSDAPTAFGNAVAERMWDLVITEFMELFVDDGGTAADEFNEMLDGCQGGFAGTLTQRLRCISGRSSPIYH